MERIQRKRTKGWKMPPNTISVTRPGEFGNPFKIGFWVKLGDGSNVGFKYIIASEKKYVDHPDYVNIDTQAKSVEIYKKYLNLYPLWTSQIYKLQGKNLECWCKIGDPCHADVLLEILTHDNKN